MAITPLSPDYSVSPQITPDDVPGIAALGFRSIICNRPDGEEVDQPDEALIRAAAEAEGLVFSYVPVISGEISDRNVEDFKKAVAELPTPVLAYCRSGGRCQNLWMLSR